MQSIEFLIDYDKLSAKFIAKDKGLWKHKKIMIKTNKTEGLTLSETKSYYKAAAAAKSLQSCPNLCDPIDSSPPDSPVPGILQARTLEWVASSFSNAGKWKVKVKSLSRVWLLATLWTAAYQAPPSMGFSRQEYWNGLPLPSLICFILIYNCNTTLNNECNQ